MAKILVIDDDPVFRKMASITLSRAGHTVEDLENGRDALAAVIREAADLIVLDLKMPTMDGTIFLQVLRSYLRWRTLPVVVVTGTTNDGTLDRAFDIGIQCAFDKTTMKMPDLVACIDYLLNCPTEDCFCGQDQKFGQINAPPKRTSR